MKKRLMLIINPAAGAGDSSLYVGAVSEIFFKNGFVPTVYYTAEAGDATRFVLEFGGGYDRIVCVGGDGTLSETVAGLARLQSPPPLGYIPQGTTNDFASTLKLPKDSLQAAKIAVSGHPMPLDVGALSDGTFFTYIAAFGAFTEISYETPRENKQALGHLAYILSGMASLPKISSYPAVVEYDGGTLKGDYVFGSVSNSTSVAGIVKLTDAGIELNDGLFEVILIKNPKNLIELNHIIGNVLVRNFSNNYVTMVRSKNVKFSFNQPVKWTRDGESGGAHSELSLQNLHSAIEIMV